MIQWIFQIFIALVSSLLAGLLLRLDSSRSPSAEDLKRFVEVLLSHEIAHRGGARDAPENTLCAFRKAVEFGYKTIEIDIQYTADSVPVVLHDPTLDRTTNGKGSISEVTLSELRTLSANNNFTDIGDCKVPTLDETIEFALENDVTLLLDVKGGMHCSKLSETLTKVQAKYPAFSKKFAVISFFPDVLYTVRHHHPNLITGFTRRHDHIQNTMFTSGYHSPALHTLLFACDKAFDFLMFYVFVPWLKINMLEIRKDDVSEAYVRDVAPIPVVTWTVNDPAEKLFFKRIGCSVMTDVVSDALPIAHCGN